MDTVQDRLRDVPEVRIVTHAANGTEHRTTGNAGCLSVLALILAVTRLQLSGSRPEVPQRRLRREPG